LYRKSNTEKATNIKDLETGEILTNPESINQTWKNYFSSCNRKLKLWDLTTNRAASQRTRKCNNYN